MNKFVKFIVKCNKIIIITTVLLTLVLGYYAVGLKINPDITSYFPKNDPVVGLSKYIGKEYGGNQLSLIALETEDVFNPETIASIHYLSTRFKQVTGVADVTSLTTVLDIKKEIDEIEVGPLIKESELPLTSDEIQELKKYTLSKKLYRGRLVSEDSKTTLIICRLANGVDKVGIGKELKRIIKGKNLKERVYYGGMPFFMIDISEVILGDLKLLTPLVSLVIIFSLFFSFKSLRGVLLPVITSAISISWTMGIMSLFKIPLTVVSDVIPVILFAIGNAYAIHLISKFDEDVLNCTDKKVHLQKTLAGVTIPVLLAGFTTMAGFLAFIFGSYLSMIREFGLFSSLGVLFSLLLSLTFIPAVLTLLPVAPRTELKKGGEQKTIIDRIITPVATWVLDHNKLIIWGGIILMVIGAAGIPRIQQRADILDYFKPSSATRKAATMMEKKFGGSQLVQILAQGDIQDPYVLKEINQMEEFLESLPNLHHPYSVADLIRELNEVMGEGNVIPDSRAKIANLWFFLDGETTMNQLVNSAKNEAVIQATMGSMKTDQIQEMINLIEQYIAKHNVPSKISFTLTGEPSIQKHLSESIIRSQVFSLTFAVIMVWITLFFLIGSVTGAFIGLVPIGFTLILALGFMGYTGIPLDIATVLVASIAAGTGIDYSIHFVNRFKKELQNGWSEREVLYKTLLTTGQAILINVITVMLGFMVLLAGNLIPLQRFGILIALTTACSGLSAITFLPALILHSKTRAFHKNVKNSGLFERS